MVSAGARMNLSKTAPVIKMVGVQKDNMENMQDGSCVAIKNDIRIPTFLQLMKLHCHLDTP